MTSSEPAELPEPLPLSPDPRILIAPPSVRCDLADDAIALAAGAGLVLDPWQETALRVGLAEGSDGRWSAFEVGVIVARQNGKDSIFEALQLAKLFLCGDELVIHSAHEFKTAKEAFRRVWSLIEADSELSARVLRRVLNPSEQGIDLKSGQRLRFFARTSGSGRGWTADTLILNEAFKLGGEQMAALLPTLSSRPNPQVWYGSSAALVDSEQLHSVRARALSGESDRLAYVEWSAPPDCDPADPAAWAQANPSPRVPASFIAAEYEAMPLAQFKRERLSIPDEPLGAAVIPEEAWRACEEWPLREQPGRPVFAVEIAPDRSLAAIVTAGSRPDGRIVVEIVEKRDGTGWILPKLAELSKKWRPDQLVLDAGSPAGTLLRDLEDARIRPRLTSTREVAQACGALYDGIVDKTVVHLGQNELTDAVMSVKKRKLGDSWAWDRYATTDASVVMAASLAFYAVSTRKARSRAVNLSDALAAVDQET